jgi:hypothetical protein
VVVEGVVGEALLERLVLLVDVDVDVRLRFENEKRT